MNNIVWTPTHLLVFADVREGRSAAIDARAGSGKSTTLVRATAEVKSKDRVVLTAFNTSAKRALEARVSSRCYVATTHSLGLKVIKATNAGMGMEVDTDRLFGIVRSVAPSKLDKDDYNAIQDTVSY